MSPAKWSYGLGIRYLIASIAVLFGQPAHADQVTACYEEAWRHPNDGGLGLPRFLAVRLCNSSHDAARTIACYRKAWRHPNDGGLGLPAGLAADLCSEGVRKGGNE